LYAFIVDLFNLLHTGRIRFFLVFFFVIWLRWLIVTIVSLKYKPFTNYFDTSVSVIIPVADEEPDLFQEVIDKIIKQKPEQLIVVANGIYSKEIRAICNDYPSINYRWTKKPGKRNAIRLGMKHASGDIIVLVDSDTVWSNDTLKELKKPFADSGIGGVTTRQKIINPTLNLRHRLCDWLEEIRFHGTMQAMSVNGKVGCLPGRTIAFRREIIESNMNEFMKEKFLGIHKEVSDDRSLTNITLKTGYKTVLQSSSVVYTVAPDSWRKYLRQQLRWSEGSQYNNIKMSGWMLKNAKLMFFIYWIDTIIPFLLWGLILSFAINYLFFPEHLHQEILFNMHSPIMLLTLSSIGAYFSYSLRQIPAISERTSHLIYIPFYILFLSLIMAPIRIFGFAKLADNLAWGTRQTTSDLPATAQALHGRVAYDKA